MTKERDIDTLARTLYGEARGEDKQGRIAVACVVLNRVKKQKMCGWRIVAGQKVPTIDATCLKKWQFSCWNENDPNRKIITDISLDNKRFAECYEIATAAVDGLLEDNFAHLRLRIFTSDSACLIRSFSGSSFGKPLCI